MHLAPLALIVPAVCLAQAPGQPRMVIDAPDHDFGNLIPEKTVTHTYTVRNAGSAPLTILQVNASCGCTSTVAGKRTLAPGESTGLEVTFDASGVVGGVEKSVQVVTNDPVEPVRTLTFRAQVLPAIGVSPERLEFMDVLPGERRQGAAKLTSGTGMPIVLHEVTLSEAPWLGVATREEGQDLWVDFDLLGRKLPPGKLSGTDSVTLRVGNPAITTFKVQVHWERPAPVTASPARVAWAEPAGRELRATVQLQSVDHKPFRILAARSSNPLLHVTSASPAAATRQAVNLVLSRRAPAGQYAETATLTLDTPGHPEFELRVAAALH